MKRLLSGILSLCLTATAATAFSESTVVNATYYDDLKECFKYYKYQVRYDYEENGVEFTHEYRVFEKEDIENLNVLPGYLSCDIKEYSPETAPYEISEDKLDEYNEIIKRINTPSVIYVKVIFYDEDGNVVHTDGAQKKEDAEKIVAEYEGEYATYEFGEYISGIVPETPKPADTLLDAGYTDYVLEYYDETGNRILEVVDGVIHSGTNDFILKSLNSDPIDLYENADGYRIALCNDYEAYHKLCLTDIDNAVQSPEYLLCDVDGNGMVDLTDLTYISLYLIGDYEFDDRQFASADIKADGVVDLADLATLKEVIISGVMPK